MLIYLQMIETPEDKSKFEYIYENYLGLMHHVAFQILNNTQDTEDAVHQAFVSIAENIKTISDVKCPKTRSYIVVIVENKAIDILRKKARIVNTIDFNENMWGIEIPEAGALDLATLMGRLPARYREVLLLRFDNGYTTKEIAKILDITPGNAEKLIWRAKNALQKLIAEDDMSYETK